MSSDLWDYGEAENSDAHDSGDERGSEGRRRKRKKMYLEVDSEKNSPSPVQENTITCVESQPQGYEKKSKPSVVDEPSTSQRQLDKEEEPDVNEEAKKQQMYLEACVHEFDEFLEEAKKSAEIPEEIEDLLDGSEGTGEIPKNLGDKREDPEEEVASNSIILVCQDRKKNSTKVRIQPSESFESLFERYAKYAFEKGWANEKDKIKYYFDGEQIQTTDVPHDLGCENQDTIDVHIVTG